MVATGHKKKKTGKKAAKKKAAAEGKVRSLSQESVLKEHAVISKHRAVTAVILHLAKMKCQAAYIALCLPLPSDNGSLVHRRRSLVAMRTRPRQR